MAMLSKPIPHLSAPSAAPVSAGPSSSMLTTGHHRAQPSLLSASVASPYSSDTTASSNPVTAHDDLFFHQSHLPWLSSFLQHNSPFDPRPHPSQLQPRPNPNSSVGKIIRDTVPDESHLDTTKPPTYSSLPEPDSTIVAADPGALFQRYSFFPPENDQTSSGTMETVSPPCGSRTYSFPGSPREHSVVSGHAPGNPPAGTSRCSSCKVKSSAEWRKGPSGKYDLCNACVFHILCYLAHGISQV